MDFSKKQLTKDGISIYSNDWKKAPAKRASSYLASIKGWVYACITKNAEAFSDLELTLYRGNRTSFEKVEAHPSLDILYSVNPYYDYNLLLNLTQIYFEAVGENFWYINPDGVGRPTEIIPLRPDKVVIVPAEGGDNIIKEYEYNVDGETITFGPEEIIRMPYPNPQDPFRGIGTIQAVAIAIDTDVYASEYNRDFFFNSAIPKGAYVVDQNLTKTTRERLGSEIEKRHNARKKAHRPALLEAGVKWEPLGIDQKDMEFLNQRKFSRDEIFTLFGVPKDLMNTEDSNRASVKEAINIYMKFTIKPRMKKFVSFLNEFYLPRFEDNLFFDFRDPSPVDVESNLKVGELGAKTSTITVNELRGLMNLDPIDGGDDIMASLSSGLGEEINAEEVTEQSMKAYIEAPGKVKKQKKFNINIRPENKTEKKERDTKEHLKNKLFYLRRKLVTLKRSQKIEVPEKKTYQYTKEQKDTVWKVFDEIQDGYERSYRQRLGSYLNAQRDRLLTQLRSRKDVKGIGDVDFNVPRERVIFVAKFRGFLENIIKNQGRDALEFVGRNGSNFDFESPAINRYFSNEAFEFVDDINKETRKGLSEQLQIAIGENESIPQIATRIEKYYRDLKKKRATTIARTETIRSFNFATLEGYKQSDIVELKEWLSARDTRVRESHKPGTGVDGERRPLQRRFSNNVMSPGYDGPASETINCRCTLLPVVDDSFKFVLPQAWDKALVQRRERLAEEKTKSKKQKAKKKKKKADKKQEKLINDLEKSLSKTIDKKLEKNLNKLAKEIEKAIDG